MALERISVVGTTGSGKTTVAAQVAATLGIEHVELDAIHWLPGWTPIELEDFRAEVSRRIQPDRWVVDGNYRQVREMVWERADTVLYLDYPFPLMFWQLLRRTIRRSLSREEIWNGNRESLRQALLSTDSLFVWQLKSLRRHRHRHRSLDGDPAWSHLDVVRLRSRAETSRWLAGLAAKHRPD